MEDCRKMNYMLYIIKSDLSLNNVFVFLNEYTQIKNELCTIRKDFGRDQNTKEYFIKDTKIALMDSLFYDRLLKIGYGKNGSLSEKLEITPYEIVPNDYAHKNGSVMHFYFPDNENFDNCNDIKIKLKRLEMTGVIENCQWFIHKCSVERKVTNVNSKGVYTKKNILDFFGIVEFSKSVPAFKKIILKIILDTPFDFRVSWSRIKTWDKIDKHFLENN